MASFPEKGYLYEAEGAFNWAIQQNSTSEKHVDLIIRTSTYQIHFLKLGNNCQSWTRCSHSGLNIIIKRSSAAADGEGTSKFSIGLISTK